MVNRIHAFGPELLAVGALAIGLTAGCATAPSHPGDLTQLGVADAARLIRDKTVTSVELTQAERPTVSVRGRVPPYS